MPAPKVLNTSAVTGALVEPPLTDTEERLLRQAIVMDGWLSAGYLQGVPGFKESVARLRRTGRLRKVRQPGSSVIRYEITGAGRAAVHATSLGR
jgi:hypothetical protein